MGIKRLIFILGVLLVGVFFAGAGRFLIVDRPGNAAIIVVLAGEAEQRPERGLQLLRDGYAPRLVFDVPANGRIFQTSQLEIAQRFIQQLPEAAAVSICPISAVSTKGEVEDTERCLKAFDAHSVLLVTSDYHSRRALSIFGKLLRQYRFEIVPVSDPNEFGVKWWERREWAKTTVEEWAKLIWWEGMERW